MTRPLQTISLALVRLAGRADGVDASEVAQTGLCDGKTASTRLGALVRAGYLHRGKVLGVSARYFAAEAAAQAWEQRAREVRHASACRPLSPPSGKPTRVPHRPATPPALPAVERDGVRVTRGPAWTHDPRYQVAPGDRPFGAGFAAVGVGRNVETGKAWPAS